MLYEISGVSFVCNFAFRRFDFRGRWSATPQNRGWSKKTQGWTGLKGSGGSLAVGTYLQRGSAPPGSHLTQPSSYGAHDACIRAVWQFCFLKPTCDAYYIIWNQATGMELSDDIFNLLTLTWDMALCIQFKNDKRNFDF